jgi:Uma2 family endonuclease
VEADESFYTANAHRMNNKQDIDLDADPPPDLAIEVEITRRLGERRLIYRDMGVPELWRYTTGGLVILVRRGDDYEEVGRSPTFPQLSPQELSGFVTAGLASDETAWIKSFRQRVRQVRGG